MESQGSDRIHESLVWNPAFETSAGPDGNSRLQTTYKMIQSLKFLVSRESKVFSQDGGHRCNVSSIPLDDHYEDRHYNRNRENCAVVPLTHALEGYYGIVAISRHTLDAP